MRAERMGNRIEPKYVPCAGCRNPIPATSKYSYCPACRGIHAPNANGTPRNKAPRRSMTLHFG